MIALKIILNIGDKKVCIIMQAYFLFRTDGFPCLSIPVDVESLGSSMTVDSRHTKVCGDRLAEFKLLLRFPLNKFTYHVVCFSSNIFP